MRAYEMGMAEQISGAEKEVDYNELIPALEQDLKEEGYDPEESILVKALYEMRDKEMPINSVRSVFMDIYEKEDQEISSNDLTRFKSKEMIHREELMQYLTKEELALSDKELDVILMQKKLVESGALRPQDLSANEDAIRRAADKSLFGRIDNWYSNLPEWLGVLLLLSPFIIAWVAGKIFNG
jgi:hypothetical protein